MHILDPHIIWTDDNPLLILWLLSVCFNCNLCMALQLNTNNNKMRTFKSHGIELFVYSFSHINSNIKCKRKNIRHTNSLSKYTTTFDIFRIVNVIHLLFPMFNAAPHSPSRRHKLNLRMKSLSLDSPESSELHSHMKRRYPPSGPVHFMQSGSAGLLDHNNTPLSNNSRLHCKWF